MNLRQSFLILALSCSSLIGPITTLAATSTDEAAPAKSKKAQKAEHLEFDDLLVQGKYQHSDEAVSTVEQDKVLDSLLGIRKDFRDRLKQSATRR